MDIDSIFSILRRESRKWDVPVAEFVRVQTKDPFRILVSVILSSRTKDEVTIKAVKRLFSVMKSPVKGSKMSIRSIEKLIYPVGFYKTKARHLKELFSILKIKGHIPDTIDELTELPGVGRKTANLVVSAAFNKPAICVDTHVHRIFNRLGYVKTKNPLETEMALRKKLPRRHWKEANRLFVAFGQHICVPVSPFCSRCPVSDHCRRIGVMRSR